MVLIDMDLPDNCHVCPFNHGEYGADYIEKCSCYITGRAMRKHDYKKRPDYCPIKVQEPVKPIEGKSII